MHKDFPDIIRDVTGAADIDLVEVIQELWSGYGTIRRYRLIGSDLKSVVVKHVHFADKVEHPRGWDTDISHQRKLRSYEVERAWYGNWSFQCDDFCRVPHCLAMEVRGDETLIVLEDLDAAGYAERRQQVSPDEVYACLRWLANFHATFMGCDPNGLWTQGTYWHLDTRPDELEALTDLPLKKCAAEIDSRLRSSQFQTLVHGDSKLANFCFSAGDTQVAAVDFQYVGGGCGMKDLAYFIGSCLPEKESERRETQLLDYYFDELRQSLVRRKSSVDMNAVESEWRALYPLAWTDFHRFLKGWCPGHWKLNDYSEKLARRVLSSFLAPG